MSAPHPRPTPVPTENHINLAQDAVDLAGVQRRTLLDQLVAHPAGGSSEYDQKMQALGVWLAAMEAAVALIRQMPEFRS